MYWWYLDHNGRSLSSTSVLQRRKVCIILYLRVTLVRVCLPDLYKPARHDISIQTYQATGMFMWRLDKRASVLKLYYLHLFHLIVGKSMYIQWTRIIYICSYVRLFRFKVEMEPYPTICRIVEELEKNESFKSAHPFNQPDCPEDLKYTS